MLGALPRKPASTQLVVGKTAGGGAD